MANAVLVVIKVPHKDYEDIIKEKERIVNKISNGIQKKVDNTLQTISEVLNEAHADNGYYDNKIEKIKELPLETILEDSLSYLGLPEATWVKSKSGNFWHIQFPIVTEESDGILQYLISKGIGDKYKSSIGIIPFSLFYTDEDLEDLDGLEDHLDSEDFGEKKEVIRTLSNFKAQQSKFLKSVTARLTVAQVVDNVRSGATLTFDFFCYAMFASWIAAMGLLDNSVVSLVASMLVSPMMGPVMAVTFGTIIKDRSLRSLGYRNLLACFAVTIVFGYLFGLICLNFTDQWNSSSPWPTDMMRDRGLPRVVWVGTLVAFPSGCAVAISLLSANESSLVGVAIAVSLLPPAVNCGLLWAFSTLRTLYSIGQEPVRKFYNETGQDYFEKPALTPSVLYMPFFNNNLAIESALLGVFSLLLSIINITNIFIGALVLLKIKEIAPLKTMTPATRRFFQEDIKIVRDYNLENPDNADKLGENVLKEWADIAGIDANELLKDTPEARVAQIQTLADIARDVESDHTFQTVIRSTQARNTDIMRRLSQTVTQSTLNNQHHHRKSSVAFNLPHLSDVEAGVIANRRKTSNISHRSSRLSSLYTIPTKVRSSMDENYERYVMRDVVTHRDNSPHGASGNSPASQAQPVFSFENIAEMRHVPIERRRRSSALRRSLQTADHLPHSVWPSARQTPGSPRFTVVPVRDRFGITEIEE